MQPRTCLWFLVASLCFVRPLPADWAWPWKASGASSASKSKASGVTIRNRKKDDSSVTSRMTNSTKRAVASTKNLLTPSSKKTSKQLSDKSATGYKPTNAMGDKSGGFKSLFVREETRPSKTVRDFMQSERVKP